MLRELGLEPNGKPGRPRLDVPAWVPPYLEPLYRRAATMEGQDGAASLVRRVKRELEARR
jgi:hypothetical protein